MKRLLFRLLGKDPEAVVVSFCQVPAPLTTRMVAEIRQLVPDREHYAVTERNLSNGVTTIHPKPSARRAQTQSASDSHRVLFDGDPAVSRIEEDCVPLGSDEDPRL